MSNTQQHNATSFLIEKLGNQQTALSAEGISLISSIMEQFVQTKFRMAHPDNIKDQAYLYSKKDAETYNLIEKRAFEAGARWAFGFEKDDEIAPDQIFINPELPLYTKFWIMQNNHPVLGIIAAYDVRVTTHTINECGWWEQLYYIFRGLKANKAAYRYVFSYEVKLANGYKSYNLKKENKIWWLNDSRVYFSLDELKNNL